MIQCRSYVMIQCRSYVRIWVEFLLFLDSVVIYGVSNVLGLSSNGPNGYVIMIMKWNDPDYEKSPYTVMIVIFL